MRRAATAIFALLVVATFGAFFAAQRLKHTPPDVQKVRMEPGSRVFSANGDGFADAIRVSFVVKRTTTITVDVVDVAGDAVRTLLRNHPTRAYRRIPALTWDGRDDDGRRAPDGIYRIRVALRDEGRVRIVPRAITLDTTPPKPLVTSIGPIAKPGPELLPNDSGGATIRFGPVPSTTGAFGRLMIFKTAPGRPRLVLEQRLEAGQDSARWNGRVDGRRVSAGTYLAVVRWRDKAGNLGASVPLDADGLPRAPYGRALPGRGGITVRYLEIAPPTSAVAAGRIVRVGVDARGACFRWSLRPVGGAPVRRSANRVCKPPFRLRVPGGKSALYLLDVRTRTHNATAPIAVQGAEHRPVLVVLPLITWQGRNKVDGDGDGAADTLDRGVPVKPSRVLAQGRVPKGFSDAEGPLLAFLASKGRRFDVTTDLDLAQRRGPQLRDYRGVVLPGDVRWLPGPTALALRRWVRGGGRLLATGLDSLRRDVSFSPRGLLVRPTVAADADLFGARLGPVVRRPVTVTNAEDQLALFSGDVLGGTGQITAPGYEVTRALGPSERLASSAVTPDDEVVIVGARFGSGLVIRTGLLRFADQLNRDDDSAQLLLRAWTLVARP